jgi:prefoldin subunit 5
MMPGKAVSAVRLQPARINEGNVFFELHRLASEQSRLLRTRQILSERMTEIDQRVEEIKTTIETIKTDHGI